MSAPRNAPASSRRSWLASLAAAPGIGASLLPIGVCPACWPAYAGLLSALGLGFLLRKTWLLPLTIVALGVAVGALAWRSRARRGLGPALLGLSASAAIVIGKFVLPSTVLSSTGIVVLVAASIWNAWPRRSHESGDGACPCCVPGGQAPSSIPPNRAWNDESGPNTGGDS
ncbi:MAG TPA: MerC domain-containing protein [Acidobacteria bacterium]|nr:MerC domain-containing protein [Acidobacteriota bacterium]